MEILIGIIVFILVIYILYAYNNFIVKGNRVKQSESTINVYLTQRFNLIPNLVECVKGYAIYESNTFENITKMRAIYMQVKTLDEGAKLDAECNRLIAIGESYPELKASEQFLNLQKNLSKMESQIQAARRIYNSDVTAYNIQIHSIPSNIIAVIFNFKEKELFKMEDSKENIEVNL